MKARLKTKTVEMDEAKMATIAGDQAAADQLQL
jgi:hypothetical protein